MLKEYGGTVSGPLSKHASFFLDAERRAIDNGSVIDAITLDPQTLRHLIRTRDVCWRRSAALRVSPRVDYQLSQNNTLMFRYGFTRNDVQDQGIGNFNLPSRGYYTLDQDHTVQITDTAVLGPSTVNETRFQFFHVENDQTSNSLAPALLVLGSFNGGGAQIGRSLRHREPLRVAELHLDRQGNAHLEVRRAHARRDDRQHFAAEFRRHVHFRRRPGAGTGRQQSAGAGCLRAAGAGADHFDRAVSADAAVSAQTARRAAARRSSASRPAIPSWRRTRWMRELFVGDDWRVRHNVTLSLGLRYETQTNIHDRRDFAPRFGFAWAPGARARSACIRRLVFRGGFGMFYSRFNIANTRDRRRYNGIVQQEYIVNNPSFFPTVPTIAQLLAMPGIPVHSDDSGGQLRLCARRTSCSRRSAWSARWRATRRFR